MSSTHNLLSLASQLQNLDVTLTSFLLEMAVKLASLTESSVFVLVENQEGRRFIGNDHLCRAYNECGLVNGGNDIELEADPKTSTLRVKPRFRSPSIDKARLSERPCLFPTAGGSRKRAPSSLLVVDDDAAKRVKAEPEFDGNNSDVVAEDYEREYHLDDSSGVVESYAPATIDGLLDPVDAYDVSWISNEFAVKNNKAGAVLGILAAEGSAGLSGDGALKRILDSVLYDLGKCAAVRFRSFGLPRDTSRNKTYLSRLFNEWLKLIPNLSELEKVELNFTPEKKYPFKVYMRAKISNTFSGHTRRKKDKRNGSTEEG